MIASLFRLQAAQLGHLWRVTASESLIGDDLVYRSSCSCEANWTETEQPIARDPEASYRRWEVHVIETVGTSG